LSFSVGSKKKNIIQTFAQLEPVIENLKINDEEKVAMRQRIISATKCMKPTNNISLAEKIALKSLKNDHTITIAKADKGNMTVVMDKEEY